MRQSKVATWMFLAVAILSMVAALIPLLKSETVNVTFFSAGVVFLIIAAVSARKAREREHKTPV